MNVEISERTNNSNERNYGVDLLRIVAMFMVVLLHVLGRGGILSVTEPMSANYVMGWLLEIASLCAVNCYGIVSGYVGYGRKHKYSNIIYLTFCVIYYIIGFTVLGFLFLPDIGIKEAINSLLHIRSGGYWYFRAYFCAFFFFPHISFIVENYDKKRLYALAVTTFALFSLITTFVCSDVFGVNNGYSPIWLMIMYFFGAVIKKYDVFRNKKPCKYLIAYSLAILLSLALMFIIGMFTQKLFGQMHFEKVFITYTSPTIVISALSLFAVFSNLRFNNMFKKMICFVSPLTFGVYLIHTQYFVWEFLKNRFSNYANENSLKLLCSTISTALLIYIICIFIDYIRNCIFTKIKIKKLSECIEKKILKNSN